MRKAATKKILYTEHAMDEMNGETDIVTTDEVCQVLFESETVEEYPEDARGHSCLMLGFTRKRRPVHVVCAPKEHYLGIITVYVPGRDRWHADFRTRRREEE